MWNVEKQENKESEMRNGGSGTRRRVTKAVE